MTKVTDKEIEEEDAFLSSVKTDCSSRKLLYVKSSFPQRRSFLMKRYAHQKESDMAAAFLLPALLYLIFRS